MDKQTKIFMKSKGIIKGVSGLGERALEEYEETEETMISTTGAGITSDERATADDEKRPCGVCQGRGGITSYIHQFLLPPLRFTVPCCHCGGTGEEPLLEVKP